MAGFCLLQLPVQQYIPRGYPHKPRSGLYHNIKFMIGWRHNCMWYDAVYYINVHVNNNLPWLLFFIWAHLLKMLLWCPSLPVCKVNEVLYIIIKEKYNFTIHMLLQIIITRNIILKKIASTLLFRVTFIYISQQAYTEYIQVY